MYFPVQIVRSIILAGLDQCNVILMEVRKNEMCTDKISVPLGHQYSALRTKQSRTFKPLFTEL